MPRFKTREEYEKWKAERLGASDEKLVEPPVKPSVSLETPLEIEETLVAPEIKTRGSGEMSLSFEERSSDTRRDFPEPQEMFLEPEEGFQRPDEKPWALQGRVPGSLEEFLEPPDKGLNLDAAEDAMELPPPRSGGGSRRRELTSGLLVNC